MKPIGESLTPLMEKIDAARQARVTATDGACCVCADSGRHPTGIGYCTCPAGRDAEQGDRDRKAREEWERRWATTGVPRRFRRYRLDTSPDQDAAEQVDDWVADARWKDGENLVISGPVGCGKTGLAVGALWDIHQTGAAPLLFQSVPALMDNLRPGGDGDALMRSCQRASVLVLDDLGAEKPSEWVRERLYVLVNSRYEEERATIVTTNLGMVGLAEAIGERSVSRLGEQATVVALDGDDRRRS